MNDTQKIWQSLIENDIQKVVYLPCNKLNTIMRRIPDDIEVLDITRESAGLGLCFGRSLAGKRSAMFIQNTGLGNLITELYTLQKLYHEALPIFVSWRGYYQEPIEAQIIFGSKVEALLNAIEVEYCIIKSAEDLKEINVDIARCFKENKVKVFLLSPEVWEHNSPDYHVFGHPALNAVNVKQPVYRGQPTLNRKGAIEVILDAINDEDVLIGQIGFPAKELFNSADRDRNFYMLGALGSATEVGIGLAMELPDRHIYVIDGDGSFFFSPNQLFDLYHHQLSNLSVICLDNGSWGSTGNQPTLSSQGMNLSAIANAIGIARNGQTDSPEKLIEMIQAKNPFIHYLIQAGNDRTGIEIPLKAVQIKNRFMQAI